MDVPGPGTESEPQLQLELLHLDSLLSEVGTLYFLFIFLNQAPHVNLDELLGNTSGPCSVSPGLGVMHRGRRCGLYPLEASWGRET